MRLLGIAAILGVTLCGAISFNLARDLKPHRLWPNKKRDYARIVTLAPSMSETLVALDQAHRVIGATIHCQNTKLAHAKKIGSFAEPNFEAILALSPDLVLAVPHVMAQNTLNRLKANSIEIIAHQPDSLADIKLIVTMIAEKLGVEDKGRALNQAIDNALESAKNRLADKNSPFQSKTALVAVSASPFVVAGKNTFASEIIEALGFINLADEKNIPWPVWPLENLLSKPPAFLILADGSENLSSYQTSFRALGLDLSLPHIHVVVPDRPIFNSPSPEVIHDANYLSRLLNVGI